MFSISLCVGLGSLRSKFLNPILIYFSQTIWKEGLGLNLSHLSMKKELAHQQFSKQSDNVEDTSLFSGNVVVKQSKCVRALCGWWEGLVHG